jgi:hypothetical protein
MDTNDVFNEVNIPKKKHSAASQERAQIVGMAIFFNDFFSMSSTLRVNSLDPGVNLGPY